MPNSQQKTESTKKPDVSAETVLKVSKEIAVKFIEMGRITPSSFPEHFKTIHSTVKQTATDK